jgi:hypothetical protein
MNGLILYCTLLILTNFKMRNYQSGFHENSYQLKSTAITPRLPILVNSYSQFWVRHSKMWVKFTEYRSKKLSIVFIWIKFHLPSEADGICKIIKKNLKWSSILWLGTENITASEWSKVVFNLIIYADFEKLNIESQSGLSISKNQQ